MQFCQWNTDPFLLDTRLQLLNSPWLSASYSPLHDAPYLFNRRQIWTCTESMKPRCCSMWRRRPATVLLKHPRASWGRTFPWWQHVSLKSHNTPGTFTQMPVTHAMGTDTSTPSQMLAFAPFADYCLDGLFHLCHREPDTCFPKNELKCGLEHM